MTLAPDHVPDLAAGAALRVLVVDDDAVDRMAVRRTLARTGFAGADVTGQLGTLDRVAQAKGELIEALPVSAAGKVLKRELRKPYWENQDRAVH